MSDSQKMAFFSPTNIVLFVPPWMQNQGVPLGSACPIMAILDPFSPQILFFLAYFGPNWTMTYIPPIGGVYTPI